VTGIADDETKVTLSCKVDTSLNLIFGRRQDNVLPVKAARARVGWVVCGLTGVVCVQWPQFCDRMVGPILYQLKAIYKIDGNLTAIAR
jgi:hypothetical protein